MSDLSELLNQLQALPGVVFVEPNRHLYMQDEVHERGRQLRA